MAIERIMGIDYGRRRVGLALSDPTRTLASSLKTVQNGASEAARARCLAEIVESVAANNVNLIVVGLPLRTDGVTSRAAESVQEFADRLGKAAGISVILLDERFTTKIASQYLTAVGLSAKKQRSIIDERSAELILQDYLERRRKGNEN